ncbi:PhnD/SsuA/transferrin family substrate-binding protein [Sulfitobacter sp. JBTF-M27]|uniref:PhnD/SsuA/transferrin family substrate-binding protein n=1 Tax=Sulfitobacter sediminilitoris TaxID=2698830 RepID=A0A6P0CA55_9RHOB|nr:PhnD/SsuA/transferrin family substrate-binding protein [Sulfitobacter sediminilitoris]NEK22747.1 PhnD/SsuA/transferrin family substrate-binding protein [Sulfitobacter sediminilitoris]
MIASLMMYARPELEAAHRRYWALIRHSLAARGIDAHETLSNDIEEFAVWEAPDLILSQTCGMPYRLSLHGKVQLVGTPDFGVEGCPQGYYRSAIVVRADDARLDLAAFRDARFAYNQTISQSGYAAPYAVAQRHGFWFANREQSGGHIKSAKAVAEGHADIAAIDAVTWRFIERYDDFARHLRVLEWTPATPGLPYITALNMNAARIFDAVSDAIAQLATDDRETLSLRGLVSIEAADYLAIANPPMRDN